VVTIRVRSKKLLTRSFLDVMTTCDVACRVSAYASLPKGKRARRATRTTRRTATLTTPNKPARIRLKLGRKAKRQLLNTFKHKRRVKVRVTLGVSAAERRAGTDLHAQCRRQATERSSGTTLGRVFSVPLCPR
jgi:hypothetical protein